VDINPTLEAALPALPWETPFRDDLFAAGLLIPSGVDGLYGRAAAFERTASRLHEMQSRAYLALPHLT